MMKTMTNTSTDTKNLLAYDKQHVWHPYSSLVDAPEIFPVVSANGVRLKLADGKELIDGMSSWWSAIHGYNHPVLNAAAIEQLSRMSHVMFGGLTHPPAVKLAKLLVDISPEPLNKVFFSDSGSVACEVAIKMAFQYWTSIGKPEKNRLLTVKKGYHGDTFATMAVCDPETGMHHIFNDILLKHHFAEQPQSLFGETLKENDLDGVKTLLEQYHHEIAAFIIEPIVQGAGGMHFYSADYLKAIRELCDQYDILLIHDEIATGFGRTGKLFACEHANISPDIMCIGKCLTAGYLTLAATLCNDRVSKGICEGEAGVFMHGPTFMANPLACSVAAASIELLLSQDWQGNVKRIEQQLEKALLPAKNLNTVQDVRVLGSIGVIELKKAVDMKTVQPLFVEQGIWIRPFGKLVYTIPPYIISDEDIQTLGKGMLKVISSL